MVPRRDVTRTMSPVGDAVLLGEAGVDLAQRLGVLRDERADPAGLGARQVLADDRGRW